VTTSIRATLAYQRGENSLRVSIRSIAHPPSIGVEPYQYYNWPKTSAWTGAATGRFIRTAVVMSRRSPTSSRPIGGTSFH